MHEPTAETLRQRLLIGLKSRAYLYVLEKGSILEEQLWLRFETSLADYAYAFDLSADDKLDLRLWALNEGRLRAKENAPSVSAEEGA